MDSDRHVASETIHAGRVVWWIDGACSNNQFRHLRRGGCGVFYVEEGHPFNKSYLLPGVEQTNQRADFHAVISSIETEQRPLEIRSDSRYVCDGFQSIAGGTRSEHFSGDNADLWSVLSCLVASRDREAVIMIKVKGHAKDRHVASGEVLAIDEWGNDKADTLAVDCGSVHSAPAHLVAAYNRRREISKASHKIMVNIWRRVERQSVSWDSAAQITKKKSPKTRGHWI